MCRLGNQSPLLCYCVVTRGRLTIWKLPEGPESVGGPMRLPLYLFRRLF
ncbi:unnamed protein product [Staurois parvus]|uniref:Uncharacterized protein n=1 Tax=Staurois parvus TaxID=386267 RepID=A0ABN9DF44_9NEOB|nr:unnamed protein product [Staurois parvus]